MFVLLTAAALASACATAYKAQPLAFRSPASLPNAVQAAGAVIAAQGFSDPKSAEEAFGFDVRGAGFLPVQVIFDNRGPHPLKINAGQSFLEDEAGNLWPILSSQTAYERATRFAQTKQIFREGAYSGFLGAAAGGVIGAAIGILTGQGVGSAAGKGAAVGAAAGATMGGLKGYSSDDARRAIVNDLNQKSLENKPVAPGNMAFGFLFFPGESKKARQLRLQLVEADTGRMHTLYFAL
ncbi:MAG: hypothetical protein HY697_01770 [Deltaproteobacteria bacterium]|nr:hypothetical protein [Deltaproteobacteria bacterium]